MVNIGPCCITPFWVTWTKKYPLSTTECFHSFMYPPKAPLSGQLLPMQMYTCVAGQIWPLLPRKAIPLGSGVDYQVIMGFSGWQERNLLEIIENEHLWKSTNWKTLCVLMKLRTQEKITVSRWAHTHAALLKTCVQHTRTCAVKGINQVCLQEELVQRRWWSACCRGVHLTRPSKQMSQRLLISALILSRAWFHEQTKDQCSNIKTETDKKMPTLLSLCSHCLPFLSLEKFHQGDRWNVKFSAYIKMQHFTGAAKAWRQKEVNSLTSWHKTLMEPPWSSPELWLMWLEGVWLVQVSVCGKPWVDSDAFLPEHNGSFQMEVEKKKKNVTGWFWTGFAWASTSLCQFV